MILHHFWSLIASAPIYVQFMENTVVTPQTYSGHDHTKKNIIMQRIQNSSPNSLLFIMHGNEVRLNWAYLPSAKLISARTWVQLPYETRNAKGLPFSPLNVELQEI